MIFLIAQIGGYVPPEAEGVEVKDRAGEKVADVTLTDQYGRKLKTSSLFDGKRPVIVVPMYYTCPVVCTTTLTLLIEAARRLQDLKPGKDYRVFVYSFNHSEKPEDALRKCRTVWEHLGRGAATCAVGDSLSVWKLSESLGFRYRKVKEGLYSHPVAVIVATPDGRFSRAIYDMGGFNATDLRLALLEAADGKIGKSQIVNSFLLYCYQYDSANRRYNLIVWRVVKLFGILTLIFVGAVYGYVLFSRRRR